MKLTYKDVPFSIDGNILEDSFTPREYNMIVYSLRLFKNVQHILTIKSSKTSTVKSMAYQMINKAIPDFIYDICNYHTEGYTKDDFIRNVETFTWIYNGDTISRLRTEEDLLNLIDEWLFDTITLSQFDDFMLEPEQLVEELIRLI
ncbi:MAG: hypothetical protein D8H99_34255 [Streptococcus sp.]|jgi:hypothetical protein|nr:MAG: hypothetical protein D8H99_34255 [Streptococcus sp.]